VRTTTLGVTTVTPHRGPAKAEVQAEVIPTPKTTKLIQTARFMSYYLPTPSYMRRAEMHLRLLTILLSLCVGCASPQVPPPTADVVAANYKPLATERRAAKPATSTVPVVRVQPTTPTRAIGKLSLVSEIPFLTLEPQIVALARREGADVVFLRTAQSEKTSTPSRIPAGTDYVAINSSAPDPQAPGSTITETRWVAVNRPAYEGERERERTSIDADFLVYENAR